MGEGEEGENTQLVEDGISFAVEVDFDSVVGSCFRFSFSHENDVHTPTFIVFSNIAQNSPLRSLREQVLQRVDGYMKRAEELKTHIEGTTSSSPNPPPLPPTLSPL